ncbi:MAG: hypothetical protein AAF384_03650 [Pseudomonadota bacterium]
MSKDRTPSVDLSAICALVAIAGFALASVMILLSVVFELKPLFIHLFGFGSAVMIIATLGSLLTWDGKTSWTRPVRVVALGVSLSFLGLLMESLSGMPQPALKLSGSVVAMGGILWVLWVIGEKRSR